MTPQDVIKKFTARLASNGYTGGNGSAMLDSAVRACSTYGSAQDVIADMLYCQKLAETVAVTTVLGSSYADKYISDLTDEEKTTYEAQIRAYKAVLFLSYFCGIDLNNADTGAITGSDANAHFTAQDLGYTDESILQVIANLYRDKAALGDGEVVLGTGTEKTASDVVKERTYNTYTAAAGDGQKINTGTRNWVVQATAADDTINAQGSDSINAGDGADQITVNGTGSTIVGGAGEDKIEISAAVKEVTLGDFNSEDELIISGGEFEIGAATIQDMVLVITDKTGTRKLKFSEFTAALDGNVNIDGNSTTLGEWLSDSGITVDDLAQENYSDEWLAELNARLKPDASYTPPITTARREEVQHYEQLADIRSDGGEINLDDYADGGEISTGTLSNSFADANTFTRNGLTIHLLGTLNDDGTAINAQTYDQLTDDRKTIVAGLFKWWAADCLQLGTDSYGLSFNSDTATVKEIGLYFYDNAQSGALAAVGYNYNSSGKATMLTLNINMADYSNIDADDVDGTATSGLLDRTLAHEFTHALMAANIDNFASLPLFIKEGTAELTHGIDDERRETIINLAAFDDYLTAALKEDSSGVNAYAGGYIFMRFLAKQAAGQTLATTDPAPLTVNVDLSGLNIGDSLYADARGNVSTDATNVLYYLGRIANDSEFGGTGGAVYVVEDNGVKQIIHTAENCTQVSGLNANTTLIGTDAGEYADLAEGKASLDMGSGEDFVAATGQFSTINTSEGNDTVFLTDGNNNLINLGDGNNAIQIEGSPLNGGNFYYANNTANSIIAGDGDDFYTNGEGYISDGKNEIPFYQFNYDQYVDLGDGNNTADMSMLFNSTVKTGAGNDSIYITSATDTSIDAGDGENYIEIIQGSNLTINAGAGGLSTLNLTANVTNFHITNISGTLERTDDGLMADNLLITGVDFDPADAELTNVTYGWGELEGDVATYNKVSTYLYEGNTYEVTEPQIVLSGVASLDDLDGLVSADGTFDATDYEDKFSEVTVYVNNVTLTGCKEILIGAGVSTINITDFGAGKKIRFEFGADEINGELNDEDEPTALNVTLTGSDEKGEEVTREVTIFGITKLTEEAEGGGSWEYEGDVATYTADAIEEGAYIDGFIGYQEGAEGGVIAKLKGIAEDSDPEVYDTDVHITAENFAEDVDTIEIIRTEDDGLDSTTFYAEEDFGGKKLQGSDEVDNMHATGENAVLDGGAGDDFLIAEEGSKNNTLLGGEGNDRIEDNGTGNSLVGGAGNDKIILHGLSTDATVNLADGADTLQIELSADKSLTIEEMDANDQIVLYATDSTTQLTPTLDTDSAGNLTAATDKGTVTFKGLGMKTEGIAWRVEGESATLTNATLGGGYLDGNVIKLNTAEDTYGSETLAQVSGMVGKAKVDGTTIKLAEGNFGEDAGITVTKSGNYTFDIAANKSITGSAAADKFLISANDVTLTTGDGNDSITLGADVTKIHISDFSADDVITFNASIDSVVYKNEALQVTAGDQVITISGATNLARSIRWGGSSGTATYDKLAGKEYTFDGANLKIYTATAEENYFTVGGLADSADTDAVQSAVSIDKTIITVNNDSILDENKTVTITGDKGYTLAVNDSLKPAKQEIPTWKQDANNTSSYTYMGAGNSAGWNVDDDGKLVHSSDERKQFTISGLADSLNTENDTVPANDILIVNETNSIVSLEAAALTTNDVTLTSDNFTLALRNVTAPSTADPHWTELVDDTVTYKEGDTSAGWALDATTNKSVTYTPAAEGATLFTITGLATKPNLNLTGIKTVQLSSENFTSGKDVTLVNEAGQDYKLSGNFEPTNIPAKWSDVAENKSTYTAAGKKEGWTLNTYGTQFKYSASIAGADQFTLSGIKATAGIVVTDAGNVQLSSGNLTAGTGVTLTKADDITTEYKLTLDNSVTKYETANTTNTASYSADDKEKLLAGWSRLVDYEATYHAAGYVAGWSIESDTQVNYNPSVAGAEQFKLSGIPTTGQITVQNVTGSQNVTITHLTTQDVTLTNLNGQNYKLQLGNGVSAPETVAADWSGNDYKSAYVKTAGYAVDAGGTTIKYSAVTEPETLFSLSGVNNPANVSIDFQNKEITITANDLKGEDVELTNTTEYKLRISGVDGPKNVLIGWDGNAYNDAYISSAGYRFADDSNNRKLEYVEATEKKTLFTLSGVENTSSLSVDNTAHTVRLMSSDVNQQTITLTDGTSTEYKLIFHESINTPRLQAGGWNGLEYKSEYMSSGYTLSDDGKTVTYDAGSSAETLFKLSGIEQTATNEKFKVTKDAEGKYIITITDAALGEMTDDATSIAITDIAADVNVALEFATEGLTVKTAKTAQGDATLSDGKYTAPAYEQWFELSDDGQLITKHAAVDSKTFDITGLSENAALNTNVLVTDGDTTTFHFKAAALNKKSVTITGDSFKVELDDDVDTDFETINESKTLTDGTLSYQAAGTGAGYKVTTNGVEFVAQVGGETFTLTGITNADDVTVNGKEVIVNESALNMEATQAYSVKLTGDDYTLKFNGTTTATEVPANFTDGNYTSAYTKAYFTGGGNEFNFVPATTPDTFNITGLKDSATLGTDILVEDKTVTLKDTALNAQDVTLTGDFTLALSGVSSPQIKSATWSGTTYRSSYISAAGYILSGKTVTYTAATNPSDLFSLSGTTSTSGFNVSKSGDAYTIRISNNALNNSGTVSIVNNTVDAKFAYASDFTGNKEQTLESAANFFNGTYTSEIYGKWSELNDTTFTIHPATTPTTFNITGLKNSATLGTDITVSDNVVTVNESALDMTATETYSVKLTGDYTLNFQGSTDATEIPATLVNGTYTSSYTSAYFTGSGNEFTFTPATTPTTFTISGLKNSAALNENVFVDGQKVTVSATALDNQNISVTEGYELELSGVETSANPTTTNALAVSGTTTTYNQKTTTNAYWQKTAANAYEFQSAEEKTTELFKLTGVQNISESNITGNVITLGAANVVDNVTLTGEYTLARGEGLDAPKSVSAKYSDGTLTTLGKSAGYVLDEKSVSYVDATTKEINFSGVDDDAVASNFWINSKAPTEITIGKAAVKTDGTPVKLLTEGYTLVLGKNMAAPKSVSAKYSDGTYTTSGKSAGYELEEKSVSYVEATTKEIKFSGIDDDATTSNFWINPKAPTEITIGKAAVKTDGTPVELLTEGYTLKLGKGMSTPKSNVTSLKGGVYSYFAQGAGYVLSDDAITYSASDPNLQLSGISSKPATPADGVVNLTADNFSDLSIVSNDEFKFSIGAGDYSGKTFTGSAESDTITNAGANLFVSLGASADSIVNSGANVTVNAGYGDDYLLNTGKNISVFGGGGNDTLLGDADVNVADRFVGGAGNDSLYGGAGADTLSGGTGNDKIFGGAGNDSILGDDGNDSLSGGAGNDKVFGGAGKDTLLGGTGNDTLSGEAGNDSLSGGTGNDSLSGGTGNDTLWGGAGNDTLLGGAGDDVFIYKPGEGTDRIFGYESGELIQLVNSSGKEVGFTNSNYNSLGNLLITVSGGGSVIVRDVTTDMNFNINGTNYSIGSDNKLK